MKMSGDVAIKDGVAALGTVPDDVVHFLVSAFGDDVGVRECTEGHRVQSGRQFNGDAGEADMLYGELLPETVSIVLDRLGCLRDGACGSILELGMGTGKVAFQSFFQCRGCKTVVGVEISAPRFEVAVAAAHRLVREHPGRFAARSASDQELSEFLCGDGAVHGTVVEELAGEGRKLWLLEGDLAIVAMPGGPVDVAQGLLLQLRIPKSARPRAYEVIQKAPDGCRAFTLENLSWEWILDEPGVMHSMREGVELGDTDLYATSWCPAGYPFYLWQVDRTKKCTIDFDTAYRNVEDLYAQAFF
mmetsp:Transcript_62862/g.126018  ORF Transcript_62862/g.126018 Transcript_62862/m.126018 type:complete len:302 (+) Transcript_62862:140-1045(+)